MSIYFLLGKGLRGLTFGNNSYIKSFGRKPMNNNFNNYRNSVLKIFENCEDLICREGGNGRSRFAVIFLRGLNDRDYVAETVLRPLIRNGLSEFDGNFGALLECHYLTDADAPEKSAEAIAKGDLLIIAESKKGFFKVISNAQFSPSRGITEPGSDVTLRGPKAGFVENAETNIALLRRIIRTPDLKFRFFTLGDVSQTSVILTYVDGRASKRFVEELSRRINNLNASVITDSTNIAMLLGGRGLTLFPSYGSTEKVDKAASKLMAGRVGIIVDGSPFVLTLPFLFIEGLQASDDYLHTPFYSTFIRLLRFFGFFAAIFAPSILCAVISNDWRAMPEEFYGIINESRKEIPVTFFWEIMAVLLLFEILREVGVRMPRTVGDAVGIVGSIILGNTAVEAGIVSSVGVITVAFSAVCAFITPAYMYVIVLSRILSLVLTELFGFWGLGISIAGLTLLLIRKKSFGVPYLTPLIPFSKNGAQDSILAIPKKTFGRRERLGKRK